MNKPKPLTSIITSVLLAVSIALAIALFTSENPSQRRWLAVGLVTSLAANFGFIVKQLASASKKYAGDHGGDPHRPTVIASLPDEMSAAAIVAQLEEHGIKARAVGGYTAGFQTEIAGDVKVVVPQIEADRANKLLGEDPLSELRPEN